MVREKREKQMREIQERKDETERMTKLKDEKRKFAEGHKVH
jgi:hypothetical protein